MTPTPPTLDTIRAALSCIPPDLPRDEWARVGMALKHELGEAGFDEFDAWSQGGETYKAKATRDTWRSIKASGAVGIGSLFHLAKQHGFKFETTQAPAPPATPEQLKARNEARRAEAAREQAERGRRQRDAAAEAARAWGEASEAGADAAGYLVRKAAKPYGVRINAAGALLVPMRNATGELCNVQTIKPAKPDDGGPDKLFLKGGRKSGLLHWCGTPDGAPVLLIAEGYATAASIHEATGRPVAVAFDCGNLAPVVRALRGRFPAARIVIAGDDDRATAARTGRNPGREKATEAAKLAQGVAVFPDGLADGASDWNDLHQSAGLDAVREPIEAAIEAAQAAQASKAAQTPPDAKKTAPAGRKRAARGNADDGGEAAAGFDRYRVEDGALWFDAPGEGGEPGRPVKVCGALHVSAWARDANDNGAALLLEFDTPFRAGRRWLMPLSMLAGDGTAYRAELLNQGFMVPTDAKRRGLLTAYLQSRKPDELVKIVDRVGWHGVCYVLPDETLGDDGGERIMFHQSGIPLEANFRRRGTADKWRDQIGRYCVGNTRLTLAACCSLAGPLLRWAEGTDAAGVHVFGRSSVGKSTGHAVAASVWGIGGDSKTPGTYIQEWKASDNGLEGLAAQHSDAALILDEFGRLDPKITGEAAYQLSNGKGKQRASTSGAARPRLTWRTIFYSAGEEGLRDQMAKAGMTPKAGQEIRFLEVPAEVAPNTMLARAMKVATVRQYGTVGREWLLWLVDHAAELSGIVREAMQAFERRFVRDESSGQAKRAGRCFALRAAAGELATAQGLTGWPAGWATEAIGECWNAWVKARPGGLGMSEDAQMMRQMREWFGTFGEMNFKRWGVTDGSHEKDVPMMAGWRKPIYGDERNASGELIEIEVGKVWYVLADKFRSTVCKGLPYLRCLELLKARELLILEPSGRMLHKARPPGESKDGADVYRIKSAILGTGDDD
jgi:putative DNA primase/helicase